MNTWTPESGLWGILEDGRLLTDETGDTIVAWHSEKEAQFYISSYSTTDQKRFQPVRIIAPDPADRARIEKLEAELAEWEVARKIDGDIHALETKVDAIESACEEFRDAVLHGRFQLSENGMSSEQTNDVLGLFDDTIGNALQDAQPNSETEQNS